MWSDAAIRQITGGAKLVTCIRSVCGSSWSSTHAVLTLSADVTAWRRCPWRHNSTIQHHSHSRRHLRVSDRVTSWGLPLWQECNATVIWVTRKWHVAVYSAGFSIRFRRLMIKDRTNSYYGRRKETVPNFRIVPISMTLSDLEWRDEIFNDTKCRAFSLRQLSFLSVLDTPYCFFLTSSRQWMWRHEWVLIIIIN